jgi:hypothetical protein
MTKLISRFSQFFAKYPKNKIGIIQMSSDHQQQSLCKKLEDDHKSIVSKGFQETFHVLFEDYVQNFQLSER